MNRGNFVLGIVVGLLTVLPLAGLAPDASADTEKAEPTGDAAPTKEKPALVTNMFYDTSLRQALSDISAQTGVVIVPDMSVQAIVTCDLKDVPLDKALDIILSVGDFEYRHMDGYILVGSASPESPSFNRLAESKAVKLSYVNAKEAVKMLAKPLQKYAQAEMHENKVFVTAPKSVLAKVVKNLRALDLPPRHVLLDTRVVVLENEGLEEIGVRYSWPQILAGAFANVQCNDGVSVQQSGWGVQVGFTPGKDFTNSLVLTLDLLKLNDVATIVAQPQIMAQDAREAQVRVATEESFIIVTDEGSAFIRSELEEVESGILLNITPNIAEEGDITMALALEVSDVVARGANNLPVVTRRTSSTTVRVKDGGTAAIAGLMDNRSQQSDIAVPYLGAIPFLGRLFRSRANSASSRQVAVFVTARLVNEEGEAVSSERPMRRRALPLVEELNFREELRASMARMDTIEPD